MASIHQVRGLLLEEAILTLLRAAGYRTVVDATGDPTLGTSAAGLTVAGRGAKHQIDAIADLRIAQPFGYPQRLLVEAKSYANDRPIGLPIVRGAVGMLRDVSEYWVSQAPDRPPVGRYHYQAAIFSSSAFTKEAQDYAFAQDIHLLPLARSLYFAPVLQAIDTATAGLPTEGEPISDLQLTPLRVELRRRLQPSLIATSPGEHYPWLGPIVNACRNVGRSLIATLGGAFSVFLTPAPSVELETLPPVQDIEIHFESYGTPAGWTITDTNRTVLFTFDLPSRLFELYADEGLLSRRGALNVKTNHLDDFTALFAPDEVIKVFRFQLARDWVERLRRSLPTTSS